MSFPLQSALVIAPRYFGYEQEIVEELRRQGAQVDLLPDRPYESPFLKAAIRFRPELTHPASDRFFERQVRALAGRDYGLILVIQGESVTARTLRRLRAAFPRARMVFYTWDSLENKPFARANLDQFDHCLTFDPLDAKRYGMRFRPLFFAPGFERPPRSQFPYDISFVGTVHSDRYSVVKRIAGSLPQATRAHWFLYIQAPWLYWVRKLFTSALSGASRSEFSFEPTNKATVQRIFFESKAVVDVEHPKQRGLTMRTIETVGSGTKLVTTNAAVRDYDFFNPHNICVVNRSRPVVDPTFLETPYQPLPPEVYERYRLSAWVTEVCTPDTTQPPAVQPAGTNRGAAPRTAALRKTVSAAVSRSASTHLRVAVAGHDSSAGLGLHSRFLNALRDADCRPVMIGPRDTTVDALIPEGFDFIACPHLAADLGDLPSLRAVASLRRMLKRGSFDMAFTFGTQSNILFGLAAPGLKLTRVPTSAAQGAEATGRAGTSALHSGLRDRLLRWSLRAAPLVVVQSAGTGSGSGSGHCTRSRAGESGHDLAVYARLVSTAAAQHAPARSAHAA